MLLLTMRCPKKLSAFTLLELLVVMTIAATLLTASSAFAVRARQAFVSQQYVKTILQEVRIARRKSMLIARSSNDSEWVHGIGVQFSKQTNGTWLLTLVKALEKDKQSFFYRSYPTDVEQLDFREIDTSTRDYLPEGVTMKFFSQSLPPTTNSMSSKCLAAATELRIIFESINGKLHAYCFSSEVTPAYVTLTGSGAESQTGINDIETALQFSNGLFYQDKVKVALNGDISITK